MSTSFSLNLNDDEITQAVIEAFGETNDKFGEDATKEITSQKWGWPNETIRKKGKKVIGSPRDIVDRGQLRGSYAPSMTMDRLSYDHHWNARHAMAVHEGAKLKNGGIIPARQFTKEPVRQFEKSFDAIAKVKLDRIK